MMLITCPHCGPRDEQEYTCGGQAGIVRPENPAEVSDVAWADYLYTRDNPRGLHKELWRHTYGCRQWFVIERDTVTHEISAIYHSGSQENQPAYTTVGTPSIVEEVSL